MKGKFHISGLLAALPVLAAACLSLNGCFQSEVYQPRMPMLFSSYAASKSTEMLATRADDSFIPEGITSLPDNSSFGVFAYYQEGVIGSGNSAAWSAGGWSPAFMFNQRVDFDGTNYTYEPLRYWPSNTENTISFWGYYPYSVYSAGNTGSLKLYESDRTTPFTKNSTGAPSAEYTVSTDPSLQSDLLFDSFAQTNKTYWNCAPNQGVVPLLFRHALCLVEFQIAEGEEAEVRDFELTGIYWKGVCPDVTASPIEWTGHSVQTPFTIDTVRVTNSVVCSLILMPQTISPSANLSLTFDISYPSFDPSWQEPLEYKNNSGSVLLTSAGISTWQAGKHYVYKIVAGYERIEFEEIVDVSDDWTIGNNNIAVPDE